MVGPGHAADGANLAMILDDFVAPAWRNRGVAQALMRVLLDHPRIRAAREVRLDTRDAESLYARFGFVRREALPPSTYERISMTLLRPPQGEIQTREIAEAHGPTLLRCPMVAGTQAHPAGSQDSGG